MAGDSRSELTKKALEAIKKPFVPNKVVLLMPTEVKAPEIDTIAPVGEYKEGQEGNNYKENEKNGWVE